MKQDLTTRRRRRSRASPLFLAVDAVVRQEASCQSLFAVGPGQPQPWWSLCPRLSDLMQCPEVHPAKQESAWQLSEE